MSKYKIYVVEQGTERLLDNSESISNLRIVTTDSSKDNIIKIHLPAKFQPGCLLDLRGIGTYIELGSTKYAYNFKLLTCTNGVNNKLIIGKNCSFWNDINFYVTEDNAQIIIGNDCMFSKNVSIWASDGHAIYDYTTGKVFNITTEPVTIGNHVWMCANTTILKGTIIGNNSVVGNGSVVSGKFDSGLVIAGNPAKTIRTGITWNRERPIQLKNRIDNGSISLLPPQNLKIIAVIPSRYGSSRFPGKPLAMILGKPMIQWVYERIVNIDEISDAYVATDDERIYNTVIGFGGKAVMTGECSCGTDRVYQACKDIDCDIVLNIQGDEPMIKPEMVKDLISAFDDSEVKMATLKKEIFTESDINNPNIAKLITDANHDAIYFSRSTIPYNRDKKEVKYYKHIGVYGYTKNFLKTFVNLPKSDLENSEQLEQLRVIENGYKIRVVETEYQSIGVDLPEHIKLVESEIKKELGL